MATDRTLRDGFCLTVVIRSLRVVIGKDQMFNLIVGAVDGLLPADRLLEGLPPNLARAFMPNGIVAVQALTDLPTLWMPEVGDSASEQVAYVGSVSRIVSAGREVRFTLTQNPAIAPIPSSRIVAESHRLGIGTWDLNRTRWTLREPDLYQSLLEMAALDVPKPTVFNLPTGPADPGSVAVMMPFGANFDGVWTAIREAAASGGWRCQRADNIWVHSAIIDDIVTLIAKSEVVICDLSGRNANVFYETGIAHALGREVILITQSAEDVPFDLRHHRHISYLSNGEGLQDLKTKLSGRLTTLMVR